MAACVNLNSKEFKETSKRLNISEKYLEPIIHKYINTVGNEDSFPSDSYIIEQLTPKPISEVSETIRKFWKDYYSSPAVFDSFEEFKSAIETATNIFGYDSVIPFERADGKYEIRVGNLVKETNPQNIDIKSLEFYSGGAVGSDTFWASEIEKQGGKVKHYTTNDYDSLSQSEKDKIERQYKEVVKLLGRKELPVDNRGKLVRRDMLQANSANTIFAVGNLEYSFVSGKTLPSGGTAYAVTRAIIDGKPVYFFDQRENKWKFYNKELDVWETVPTPIITNNSALIGTRSLEDSGRKAIRDVVNKTVGIKNEREFTFSDGTTVETPFKLNQQQENALNSMNDFINSDETHMTLSGYAGTGKTSLMEILAKKVDSDGKRIVFSATTNKAAAVLKSKVSKSGFEARTLNKVFGISVEVDSNKEYNAKDLVRTIRESKFLYGGEIVVIDEASMIDETNYRILNDIARGLDLKIIYVGDKAQLAPVKETQVSKVFRDNTGRIAELTQVERTADNAILKEATAIRNGEPLSRESSFNSNGEGVAYVRNGDRKTVASIVRHFVQGLRNDPNHFRILAYTNAMVAKYNEAVRRTLGYNDNIPRVGEPMVGYNNWGYVRGEYRFVNSESYKVVDVKQQETRRITVGNNTYSVESIPITLEDSLGNIDTFDFIDIKANQNNRSTVEALVKEKTNLWSEYRRTKNKGILSQINDIEKFLFVNDEITEGNRTLQTKTIDFGYALTIHKSQGSTFTHVLMDDVDVQKADMTPTSTEEIDLDGVSNTVIPAPSSSTANVKQQLEYVGVSRATTTVTIISDDVKTEDSPLNHIQTKNQAEEQRIDETKEKQNLAETSETESGTPERIDPQLATEEETKEIISEGQEVRSELQQFQDENSSDVRELNNLFNSAKLSNSEVRYVAKQLIFGISDFITDCLENPQKYLDCFPELFANMSEEQKAEEIKKIGEMTRLEFYKYATPQRVLQNVARKMFFPVSANNPNGNTNLNTIKKISRAKVIAQNLNGLMRLANDTFVIAEDFSIVYTRDRNEATDKLRTVSDDINTEDDTNAELGKTLETWQFEFRTQDAISRMSQQVKRVLGRCFEYTKDKDGNYVQVADEWGIAKRIDMGVATSSIVAWVRDSMSLSEMIEKLRAKESENPWISQIISLLEDTSGENSDFQSQFYNVFAQSFQPYSIVKRETNENGEYEYKTLLLNERPARKKAYEDLRTAYQLNTIPLFTKGEVNASNAALLETMANQLVEMSNKGIDKIDWTKAIDLVYKAASIIGYDTTLEEVAPTISSNAALTKVSNAFQNIALNVKKAIGMTEYAPFKYNSSYGIGGFIQSALDVLTSKKEETAISSIYDNGKMYQSNVIPSFLTRLMSRFREKDDAKLREFIENEYGAYSWFKAESGWKNMVLRDFLRAAPEAREKLFKHKVQLNFNKHNYMKDLTENELALSILTEYASGLIAAKGNVVPTYFKVPMLSNKPSSEFISLNAYLGDMVETKLLPGFAMIFMQELGRIQTVRMRDYDKSDPEFIKNFDKNGKKFMFLDFFNQYLNSKKSSELGKLINKALNEGMTFNLETNKGLTTEENTRLNILVKEEIKNTIDKRAQSIVDSWKKNGVFEAAKQIQGFSKNEEVLERQLKDFVWNDTFAAMNILELTVTDIAYYKDAEDLQKRFAQIHAPGTKANVEARDYEGRRVSDGNFRTFLLKDFDDFISNTIDNLQIVFNRKIAEAKKNGTYNAAMQAFYDDIIEQYKNINVADAQGYSSPTSYRKKAFLFGRWSKQAEDIYRKLESNNYNYSDLKTAFQPLKPFVYGQINKPSLGKAGEPVMNNLKVPVQFKNSEYLLIMADAILRNEDTGKPNLLRAIYNIMEDSAKENPETCIDTVQFESTCKSGLMAPIDIKQFYNMKNGEDAAYVHMRNCIYKNGVYNTDVYVYEMPFDYYSIQQEVPAHFRDHEQAHGSQIRYIIPSDLETVDSEGNAVTYDFIDNGVKKSLSAQEFRNEYEENIAANIRESIDELSEELGLNNKFVSKKDRNIALSKILIKEIFDSPRYGVDLATACSVNEETGEFNIPLGDPIQSKRIEQLINSVIKNRINKQEIAGGPVVQVSNFGTSKELHIRYNKKGGGLLMTKEEFAKTAPGPEGKYNIDAAYKKYIEDNQAGIAYYEVYAPIYVNELFKQFADKNGNIDIQAIEEVNPDLLKMIGYRIPTEDKYSMAPLKIVGFLPREAGDGIMLPNEITLITGSDFDVDKFYLMRKEIGIGTKNKKDIRNSLYESMSKRRKDSYAKRRELSEAIEAFLDNPIEMRNSDALNRALWNKYKELGFDINVPTEGRAYRNNKIIDMSWAVLTHETTVDKMMNPGGFTPEKTMGYMVSAYQNPANKFTWEELEALGDKRKGLLDGKLVDIDPNNKDILVGVDALKDICYTEKNLSFIDTHLQFYKQNSAAATALGMAAVQKVAHAVLESNGYQVDIEAITELQEATDEATNENFLFEIAGFKLKSLMELDAKKNSDGNLIGRILGELVAMFADAVKDPVANLLNINNTIMPYLTTLIRLGMPFRKAALFLAQPIIRDALTIYNAKNLSGFTSFANVISELRDNLAKELQAETESNYNNINSLEERQLIKNLKESDRNSIIDYTILGFLQNISLITEALKPLTYATRFNSISNAVGPLIVDNLMMEFKMNKMNPSTQAIDNRKTNIYDRNGEVVGFDDVLAEHPILEQFARASEIANEIFSDMPTNSEKFRNILIKAPEGIRETLLHDRKLLTELSDFFQSYLLLSSGVVKETGKNQGLKYYIEQFPMDFISLKAKSLFAGNALIDAIRYDTQNGKIVLKIDTTGMQTQDKEVLSDGWVDLYNSGERGQKLALHLFYYNFFRTGIGFSPKSFMGLFPSRLKDKIEGYTEAFTVNSDKFASEVNEEVVLDQFIRNNADNSKLIPRITLGKDGFSYSISEDTGEIVIENARDLEDKTFVKTKKNGKFTLYKQTHINAKEHRVSYTEVEMLGNNGEYFEISTDRLHKAVTLTSNILEQNKDNGAVNLTNNAEDISIEEEPVREVESNQKSRATRIRDKIIEFYESEGKTANNVEAYSKKSEQEKQELAPRMKQFFRDKFKEFGIKYDEKLVDEFYDNIC